MLRQFIRFLVRHFACDHKERILTMIVREPITYTRRAQYYCPSCEQRLSRLPERVEDKRVRGETGPMRRAAKSAIQIPERPEAETVGVVEKRPA